MTLLTTVLNPKIVVIDGTSVPNGHGPKYGEAVKDDLITAVNNPVVAEAFGSANKGIPVSKVENIMFAEKEDLGTTNRGTVQFNDDWKSYQMRFRGNKTMNDRLSMLPFNSKCMAKQVIDSPLKSRIYRFVHEIIMNRRIDP